MAQDFAEDFNSAAEGRPSTNPHKQDRYQICIQELTNDPAGNGIHLLDWLKKIHTRQVTMMGVYGFLENLNSPNEIKTAFVEALAHTRGVYDMCLQQFPVPNGGFLFDRSRDWKENYNIVASKISEREGFGGVVASPRSCRVEGPRTLQ